MEARIVRPDEPRISRGEQYVILRFEHEGRTADFNVKERRLETETFEEIVEEHLPKARATLLSL